MKLDQKKVLVIGMARSGISTARALKKENAIVTINDVKTKEQLGEIYDELKLLCDDEMLGGHPSNLESFDLMVLSPGVPTNLAFISEFRALGKPIIGELELAYRLAKGHFIGITGTNGKTTTTALTGEIFKKAELDTYIVGNIGDPVISKVHESTTDSYFVTEVSSFQLESTYEFNPHIAAILNITPDHLNRHKTMENYIEAKAKIFENHTDKDYLILNAENELTKDLASKTKSQVYYFSTKEELDRGAYLDDGMIVFKDNNRVTKFVNYTEVCLKGNHNIQNALAAVIIAQLSGVDKKSIVHGLKTFGGFEHRFEFVRVLDNVNYYNDSKATNVESSLSALEMLDRPTVLIAGGMDKKSSYDKFVASFDGKIKALVLLGETKEQIKQTALAQGFENSYLVTDMKEAVAKAYELAVSGDNVVLSPACASCDMYPSFEVRGNDFKDLVKDL